MMLKKGLEELKINNTEGMSPATIWEASKAFIRGILLAAAKKKRRDVGKEQNKILVDKIQRLEQEPKKERTKEIQQRYISKN